MASETFSYTGSLQTWDVPNNVTEATIRCWGAGGAAADSPGETGGYAEATVGVSEGETLYIRVGGAGDTTGAGGYPDGGTGGSATVDGGFNVDEAANAQAGGAGGRSGVRYLNDTAGDAVAIAGGGGGGSDVDSASSDSATSRGGAGGGSVGENSPDAVGEFGSENGANGGTQSSSHNAAGQASTDKYDVNSDDVDEYSVAAAGGGGGGGYNTGQGGGADTEVGQAGYASGGAGGAGFVSAAATSTTLTQSAGNAGDGLVEVEWTAPPAAPNNTQQDIEDDDTATVTWDADTAGGAIDGYEVELSTDGGAWTQVAAPSSGTTSHTEAVAQAVDAVQYRVRAVGTQLVSDWVSTTTETTNATGVSITSSDADSIDLSWADPSANDATDVLIAEATGSTAADYTVDQSVGAAASTATITGLEHGEQYYVRVQAAYTGADKTPAPVSNEASATTDLPTPTLNALDAATLREVTLSYALTDNSTDGDVLVERSTDGGSTWSTVETITDLSATTFTDTGLLDGEQYTYRLTRRTDHASTLSGTLAATTILPAPSGLTHPTVGDGYADYEWQATHNNGETRVEHKLTDASSWQTYSTVSRSTESETVDGLRNGEAYDSRVVAQTEHVTTEDA